MLSLRRQSNFKEAGLIEIVVRERVRDRERYKSKKKNIKIKLTRTKRDQRKSNSCGVHVLPTSGRSSVICFPFPSVSSNFGNN